MTDYEIAYVQQCILDDDVHRFYTWTPWIHLRDYVLKDLDKGECQLCKQRGRHRRATHVHHVNHLRDHPELALEIWYTDIKTGEKKRQLISLCRWCHEEQHPERLRQHQKKKSGFTTEERW